MTPSPRAFSRRTPFDWPLFARTFHLQPLLLWSALALPFRAFAHAAVILLGASCAGPAREAADSVAVVLYVPLIPAAAAVAYYALFARRRLAYAPHRRFGDFSLAMLLFVSLGNACFLAAEGARRWSGLSVELSAVRAACWPTR